MCEYCKRERPWLKNGIWLHTGGVVCVSPPNADADAHAVWGNEGEFPSLNTYRPQGDDWPHKRLN